MVMQHAPACNNANLFLRLVFPQQHINSQIGMSECMPISDPFRSFVNGSDGKPKEATEEDATTVFAE
jgi:hypothetical protein